MGSIANVGSEWVDGDLHFFDKATHTDILVIKADGTVEFGGGLDFTGASPDASPLLFDAMTLPANSNVLRGAGVNPTRISGWTSFSGTVEDTPAQVYMDYRELHTTGAAEVLGTGAFAFADAGASIASMLAAQFIAEVDAGAIVLTAGDAAGIGVFASFHKLLLNGETFNPGGVAAAQFLSVQANVTDVSAEDVSIWNAEIASGKIRSMMRFRATGGAGATNFFELGSDVDPIAAFSGTDPKDTSPDKLLRVKVGAQTYAIPMYEFAG